MKFLVADGKVNGDLVFLVGSESTPVRAHSSFVRASTLLARCMADWNKGGPINHLTIRELTTPAFEALLLYIYTGDVKQHHLKKFAIDLLPVAHFWLMEMLEYKCVTYICWTIQVPSSPRVHAQQLLPERCVAQR
jgi:hypothetical protein